MAVGDQARAATAVLLDSTVLIDLTPGPAFAAARAGQSLHGVGQVLLSHPQDGPPLQFPDSLPVPVRVPEGECLTLLSGHQVRAVPLDAPGTGYDVTGPGGQRLLYLPPGGAVAGLPTRSPVYDLVLLDVVGRPDALARLRASGAVSAATDVLAVHLDHDVPPGAELRRRLAAVGARTEADGCTLTVGAPYQVPDVPRRTLVLGGARSGKSVEAERRLAASPDVVYVATGGRRHGDTEWRTRVTAHRERRPASWHTVETCELVPLLTREGSAALLIDCLSLWLTDAMDELDAWDDDTWRGGGARKLRERVEQLTDAVRGTHHTVVAVSNEVGSGVVPATPAGRRFRDELGRLNAAFAAECEQVLLVVAGTAVPLSGCETGTWGPHLAPGNLGV